MCQGSIGECTDIFLIKKIPCLLVDVTDLWHSLMWKINHNSVNLYQIPTKIGKKMCINKSFMWIKFQLDRSMCSCFMGENAKCAKWRIWKKQKKIFWNFVCLYLGIGQHNLLQIWYVDLSILGKSQQQIWLNLGKKSHSYIYVKIMFFVFLLIYSRCGTTVSWAAHLDMAMF